MAYTFPDYYIYSNFTVLTMLFLPSIKTILISNFLILLLVVIRYMYFYLANLLDKNKWSNIFESFVI